MTRRPRIALLNPNATEAMTEEMAEAARGALAGAADVVALTNRDGPPSIQGPADGEACLPGLFALVARARAGGADAIIVGCFDDTGVAALRREAGAPVVGIGEAGMIAGALAAPRFAVVTSMPVAIPVIEANIRALRLDPVCAGVVAAGVPVLRLHERADAVAASLAGAAARFPDAALVLGCGGLCGMLDTLSGAAPARLVEPVRAAAGLALGLACAGRAAVSAARRAG